ncbi:hypothetical protein BFJ71_g6845 [Fusarium oxysporum]|nr:hypothetical protein BFJ71_g6845 [Fusarium oxysporum]
MAPRLTTIDASEPLDRILEAIARDGGVIVSNFLEPELLNDSMRAIEPFFSGGKMYDPKSAQKDLGDDFFPEGSQRAYDDVNYGTGSLHDPKNPLFTPMVGCLIAGSRATYKNGATAVIPGSHLWGPDRAPKVEECTYAEMEPGSALFTLGTTYHGGGTNQCQKTDPDAVRTLFAIFGQRDFYRQDQQEILSTPIETARSFPDDILKLTGYYKAVGGVGFIGDHQDPVELLHVDTNGVGKFSK